MKMLLIDDDAVSRSALIEIFGPPPGWEVIETDDGANALELLNKGLKPEFCVVDLLMPQLDGMAFLQHVRKDAYLQHLKVVVTSSKRDRSTIVSLAQLQVSGYLLKPFDAGKTRATLKQFVSGQPSVGTAVRKSAKYSLLAVDDDPVMREVITAFLTDNTDWEVKFAVDGDDAFECLYAGLRPDLILTDLNMANSDGLALIKRIRKDRNFATAKVAVITGKEDPEKAEELASLDMYAYMIKPFDRQQMTNVLRRIADEQP